MMSPAECEKEMDCNFRGIREDALALQTCLDQSMQHYSQERHRG